MSLPVVSRAAQATNEPPVLANLSFAQLSQIEVVSVSKRPETASDLPAAVRVVTADDIARSGATSIPEALRNVPGLNVAQINGSDWAIAARGFQSQYGSKLLVLMDGRSLYSPVFGGVFWNMQDYFLSDIDQIEVVLGPGGSIWGFNAMNGVINIITKSAKDTQGGQAYGGGGNSKLGLAGARYGWQLADDTYVRVYGKYGATDGTHLPNGNYADDDGQFVQIGFRMDGECHGRSQWTLQGDAARGIYDYHVTTPDLANPPGYVLQNNSGISAATANLTGGWETDFSPDSTLRLKADYDYQQRVWALSDTRSHAADFELHHTWSGWARQQIDSGIGYRFMDDQSGDSWSMYPPDYKTHLANVFVQDEIALVEDVLLLTAGTKLEYSDRTDVYPEPSIRLTWHPARQHTIWAAWSMAIRSPAELEESSQIDAAVYPPGVYSPTLPAAFRLMGNNEINPEQLQSFELGWRWETPYQVSFDTSLFYYNYDDLISFGTGAPYLQTTPVRAIIIPSLAQNGVSGRSYGGEISVQWHPWERWQLRASYSYLKILLHAYKPDPVNFAGNDFTSPQQSAGLNSAFRLAQNLDLDAGLRYVDAVPGHHIPAYVELDAQLAWQARRNLELALVGQNLIQPQHAEYQPAGAGPTTEIERGVYARLTIKF